MSKMSEVARPVFFGFLLNIVCRVSREKWMKQIKQSMIYLLQVFFTASALTACKNVAIPEDLSFLDDDNLE